MRESHNFIFRAFLPHADIFMGDTAAFRTKLYELWFENYDRASSGSALGSRSLNEANIRTKQFTV